MSVHARVCRTIGYFLIVLLAIGFTECKKDNNEKILILPYDVLRLVQGEDSINASIKGMQVTNFGSNPGNLNMYKYIPQNMPPNAALVVVLHGCSQQANAYEQGAGWNQLADLWKFYVIYPEQKSDNNPAYCFNWAGEYGDPANLIRGQGENLSIKQMVDYMKANYSIDSNRVFITGLSAGAAFSVVMLATWPDVFKAGAIMAGVPYRCATDVNGAFECMNPGRDKTPQQWGDLVRNAYSGYSGPYPRVSIWHGDADTTVYPINQRELMEQWTNVHGTDQTPDIETTVNGYPYKAYKNSAGKIVIETYTITGMQHGTAIDPQWNYPNSSTPCGQAGAFILDTNICSTYYAAKFFGLDNSDNEAPSVSITSPTNGSQVTGNVTISVDATDNVGVDKIEIYIDNVLKKTLTTSPYNYTWDSSTATNGTHTIYAKAYDAEGNVGTSNTISVSVSGGIQDTTSPTVTINYPDNNSTVYGVIELSATANDDVGVTKVEFYVDSTFIGEGISSGQAGPYTLQWDTKTVTNGTHTITVKAYDAAGNIGSASKTVIVDQSAQNFTETFSNSGPDNTGWNLSQFSISSSVDHTGQQGSGSLFGSAVSNTPTTVTKSSSINISLGSNPQLVYWRKLNLQALVNMSTTASFRVKVNGTIVDEKSVTYQNYSDTNWEERIIDLSNYANATVTLTFEVSAINNVYMPVTAEAYIDDITIRIPQQSTDTTPPNVSITSPSGGANVSGSIDINANASDNQGISKVEFYIDGNLAFTDETSPYKYTWNTTSVSNGNHNIEVKAYDTSNNISSASITVNVNNGTSGTTIVTFNNISSEDGYVKANSDGSSASVGWYTTLAIGRGSDGKYNRAILSFDTSSIPDNASITRAYIKITYSSGYGDPWVSPTGNQLIVDIKNGCFGGCTIESTDWNASATATEIANIVKFTSGTQNSTDFNASGLNAINIAGKTQIRLRFKQNQTSTNYIFIQEGSSAQLVVEYQD